LGYIGGMGARDRHSISPPTTALSLNAAEAKRRFSELLGRVAFGGATVLITRRGRPMARLVPVTGPEGASRLSDVTGWLEEGDPFFAAIDAITEARGRHLPRAVGQPKPSRGRGGKR
jgi:prevent-host-death family protein